MENRFQRIFLIALLLGNYAYASICLAQDDPSEDELEQIITPDIQRRSVNEDDLDNENFEIGAFFGLLSIEDFGANEAQGVTLSFHITEDFFVEGTYATSSVNKTSYELLSGGVELLTQAQRELSYYNLSLGYNFLPGQIYFTENWAFNTNFYLVAGAGNTDFAAKKYFTTNIGAGLRFYATDWVALDLSMRNHRFSHELFGETKTVNNLESRIGLSVFF